MGAEGSPCVVKGGSEKPIFAYIGEGGGVKSPKILPKYVVHGWSFYDTGVWKNGLHL